MNGLSPDLIMVIRVIDIALWAIGAVIMFRSIPRWLNGTKAEIDIPTAIMALACIKNAWWSLLPFFSGRVTPSRGTELNTWLSAEAINFGFGAWYIWWGLRCLRKGSDLGR